jgi:crotonobetaine/carnitine-CoA ligase
MSNGSSAGAGSALALRSGYREFPPAEWSLDRVLEWRARRSGGAPFLCFQDGAELSFEEAWSQALDLAFFLQQAGVRPGDRVSTLGRNSMQAVLVWFAINLLGAADAPVNPAFVGRTLVNAVNLVEAEIVVADAALLPALQSCADELAHARLILAYGSDERFPAGAGHKPVRHMQLPAPRRPAEWQAPGAAHRDLCSILFTSGTTGPAKGAMITHAQAFLTAMHTVQGLRVVEGDRYYCAHPLFHMSPRFCVVYAALLTGAQASVDERFVASRWIDRVRETGATVTIGHGPLLEMIHAEPERADDADTRLTRLGSSPFPKHIAADFERRFGVKGIETWGMTEVNIPCWHPFDEPLRAGSCGKVLEDWYELKVVHPETDEAMPAGQAGELVVRPKFPWTLSPGYYGNPQATMAAWRNLWFHSGDSGYIDEDGWVYFVDRLGDRIRRRAENISSYDIEAAAKGHAAVAECAAVGVPSEFASDDDIKLCLVLRPGAELDGQAMVAYLLQRLPHHMVPRYVEFLPELPRTPTQKVMKSKLRASGHGASWDRKAAGVALRDLATRDKRG